MVEVVVGVEAVVETVVGGAERAVSDIRPVVAMETEGAHAIVVTTAAIAAIAAID